MMGKLHSARSDGNWSVMLPLCQCNGARLCRYCTEGAYFCVKEVDLAITADMGTLQRLPGIVGDGALRIKIKSSSVLPVWTYGSTAVHSTRIL